MRFSLRAFSAFRTLCVELKASMYFAIGKEVNRFPGFWQEIEAGSVIEKLALVKTGKGMVLVSV